MHFGIIFDSIGEKTYFLALGMIAINGVSIIARKITDLRHLFLEEFRMTSDIVSLALDLLRAVQISVLSMKKVYSALPRSVGY